MSPSSHVDVFQTDFCYPSWYIGGSRIPWKWRVGGGGSTCPKLLWQAPTNCHYFKKGGGGTIHKWNGHFTLIECKFFLSQRGGGAQGESTTNDKHCTWESATAGLWFNTSSTISGEKGGNIHGIWTLYDILSILYLYLQNHPKNKVGERGTTPETCSVVGTVDFLLYFILFIYYY